MKHSSPILLVAAAASVAAFAALSGGETLEANTAAIEQVEFEHASTALARLAPPAGERISLTEPEEAPVVDSASARNGESCKHYATVLAQTPMTWPSTDWSLTPAPGEEASLPEAFAATRDKEDPFACTLAMVAADGRYTVRQKSTLWESEISLSCEQGTTSQSVLSIPPAWPLNVYVLDADGANVEDVHVSVARGSVSNRFVTVARAKAGGGFTSELVSGVFSVIIQGASKRPIFKEVEVANGPTDVIVDLPTSNRFEVNLKFQRDGNVVKVSPDELRKFEALDAGHNDALISTGGRYRAKGTSRAENERFRLALQARDREALSQYLSGYEIVSLVLASKDEVTVRALGVDVQVNPALAGSVIDVIIP